MSKKNNEAGEEGEDANAATISETGKDIKQRMDMYEANFTSVSGEEAAAPPAADDSTRSEE